MILFLTFLENGWQHLSQKNDRLNGYDEHSFDFDIDAVLDDSESKMVRSSWRCYYCDR